MKGIKSNNRGFTLIDVICAVTIMMLVVLPIFTGFLMAAKTNAAIDDRLEVEMTLQNIMEQIKYEHRLTVNVKDAADDVTTVLKFEKGDVDGNYAEGEPLPKGDHHIKGEEYNITLFIEQVKVISQDSGNNKIAYYKVTLTHDNGTEDDQSDDVILEGVCSPW